jgi:glutamine synthetase
LASSAGAWSFLNEKDHPEAVPTQFEINYSYTDVVGVAD